jgi:phosphoglycolate phosphatase
MSKARARANHAVDDSGGAGQDQALHVGRSRAQQRNGRHQCHKLISAMRKKFGGHTERPTGRVREPDRENGLPYEAVAVRSDDGVIAILFDVDGTLITTYGASAVTWRRVFADLYEIPADIGTLSHAGLTDPEVGRLIFTAVIGHDPSPSELAQLMAKRLEHLPAAVAESTDYRVLPGVQELLPSLASRGYLLGLATGLVESAAHIKLARGDLNKYFPFGGYGSDSPNRTELTRLGIQRAGAVLGRPVDPQQTWVIGDTPLDIAAAHGAGAIAVGVVSGGYTAGELRDAGAELVLDALTDELPL